MKFIDCFIINDIRYDVCAHVKDNSELSYSIGATDCKEETEMWETDDILLPRVVEFATWAELEFEVHQMCDGLKAYNPSLIARCYLKEEDVKRLMDGVEPDWPF